MVADPETLAPVPADGATVGEIMLRGNTVMKGYLGDADATADAFRGGWFHSGDLAVTHPDGYIQITDRAKDIIISGGENISSLEVENALYSHEAVLEAAVVARPDERWGESPCAFIALKPDARRGFGGGADRALPRAAGPLQGAAHGRLRRPAEDGDRQDQEVRAARARPRACGQRRGWRHPGAQGSDHLTPRRHQGAETDADGGSPSPKLGSDRFGARRYV